MNPSDGPIPPDENRVREACRKFDDEYGTTERALKDLLRQYSTNDDEAHVFLKVVAVNRLYFAGPLDVHGMAEQIHLHADTIDPALAQGAPSIVDEIARFIVDKTGCKFYSFASKYCSWHNPSSYPIWDGNVCRYLASLKNTPFAKSDNWERYAEFVALMAAFSEHYRLDLSGFEDIDKLLWMNGGESSSIAGGPPKVRDPTLLKHGGSFEEARSVFLDESARSIDDPDHSEDEDRFLLLGYSFQVRCLIVSHCYREFDFVIRLISAGRATAQEEKAHWSLQ